MKKVIRLTETQLINVVKRIINEGVIEDITPIIDKTISNNSTKVSDLWDITNLGNNTISISPKGQNKPTKLKISFPGKTSFKLEAIRKALGGDFQFQVALKNKDFPLTWGIFKNLPGSGTQYGINGYVYDRNNKKWISQKDVQTSLLGKIEYEDYGYTSSDDVDLRFTGFSQDKMLKPILQKLKVSNMQPFQHGLAALDAEITLTPLA